MERVWMRAPGRWIWIAAVGLAACVAEPLPFAGGSAGAPDLKPPAPPDVRCWKLPPPPVVAPRQPSAPTSAACASQDDQALPAPDTASVVALLVGRWVRCGAAAIGPENQAGIEVGGNLRWRVLDAGGGALVPRTPRFGGALRFFGDPAQVNLEIELDGSIFIGTARFTAGGDVLRYASSGFDIVYARAAPAANNGLDNVPAISDGRCTLVGTWDAQSPQSGSNPPSAASFSWNADGQFIGGDPGADLCQSHFMEGTYALGPGRLTIAGSGMGCPEAFSATYQIVFDADCKQLTVTTRSDNCTGGRRFLSAGTSTLVKRP